jgi:hypothetical protein
MACFKPTNECPKMMCCVSKPSCERPSRRDCPPCPPAFSLNRCRSRELRGSILHKCECPKRNGLADDCKRRECFGRPRCVAKPIPCCCPSKFVYRYANVTMGKPTYTNAPMNNNQSCSKKSNCCPEPMVMMCNECPTQSVYECSYMPKCEIKIEKFDC